MADFQIGEAISFGWKTATKNFGFFLQVILLLLGLVIVLGFIQGRFELLGSILSIVFQIIASMGLITVALKLVDGKQPRIQDLWGTYKPFGTYLGASLLVGLGVLAGMILLVIPGVILSLGWMFSPYLIVDKRMKAIESIKRSWEITKGQRWQLLGLGILLWLMNVAGMLLAGIGLLWTVPVSVMAMAYVYRKLEGEAPVAVADGPASEKAVKPDLPKSET